MDGREGGEAGDDAIGDLGPHWRWGEVRERSRRRECGSEFGYDAWAEYGVSKRVVDGQDVGGGKEAAVFGGRRLERRYETRADRVLWTQRKSAMAQRFRNKYTS